MRIDEFSNTTSIDGVVSIPEQTRFLLFGFDISLDAPVEVVEPEVETTPALSGLSWRSLVNSLDPYRNRKKVAYVFSNGRAFK